VSNQPERGAVAITFIVVVLSALVGGGVAWGAISAVVSSTAPNDTSAVQNGPQQPVDPTQVIRYGG
jgi:hypothetical protein